MNLTFEDNVLFFHLAPLRACKENNLQNLGRKISDCGSHLGSPFWAQNFGVCWPFGIKTSLQNLHRGDLGTFCLNFFVKRKEGGGEMDDVSVYMVSELF